MKSLTYETPAQTAAQWADAPLTPEEEQEIEQARANAARGDVLTLEEFLRQAAKL